MPIPQVQSLHDLLREEFQRHHPLPDWSRLRVVERRAQVQGARLAQDLAAEIGRWPLLLGWNLSRLPGRAGDAVTLLGWSALLTEFLIRPLVPDPDLRRGVVRLGALANLIVNHYDHLLDHFPAHLGMLSRMDLQSALSGETASPTSLDLPRHPAARLIPMLVRVYSRWLRGLPGADSHPGVLQFVRRLILRMHRVEREPLTCSPHPTPGDRRSLMIRDVYPFIVMGTPAWMYADPSHRQTHFVLLYKTGRLIGLLDDAADLEADRRAGCGNLFASGRWASLSPAAIASELDALYSAVLSIHQRLDPEAHTAEDELVIRSVVHAFLPQRAPGRRVIANAHRP